MSQSPRFGYWLLGPLVVIYFFTNAALIVLAWIPVNEQQILHTKLRVLLYWVEPGQLWSLWSLASYGGTGIIMCFLSWGTNSTLKRT